MDYRLLGPVEVLSGHGRVPLGGSKPRTLLVHLLLGLGRLVPASRLIDAVWDAQPPASARNSLQTYVSHLRMALGADRLEGRSGGYVLHGDPGEVDAVRFQQLLRKARRQAAADPADAVGVYDRALALWRGPALADLADQPSLRAEIARLEELRLTATEERIATVIDLGLDDDVVSELERLVAQHPLRETLWAHLMRALYGAGRQGDALDAFHRARTLLADELGVAPSPALQRLQRRILRQDAGLAPGSAPAVALVFDGRAEQGFCRLITDGFDRAVNDFGLDALEATRVSEDRLRLVSERAVGLIIAIGSLALAKTAIPARYPDRAYAIIDWQGGRQPNVTNIRFADEQGSFLVGAAAALKTRTRIVGFIGGVDIPSVRAFQAGFEAGVSHVDPGVTFKRAYLSQPPDFTGFTSSTLAARNATVLYRCGADVVYHAAATAGLGLLEAAVAESRRQCRHLWAIGVDVDEYVSHTRPLWEFGPKDWRPHILTSMVKRVDVAVYQTIAAFARGRLAPGDRIWGLADGGVDYATSGGFIDDIAPELRRLKRAIIDGRLSVPRSLERRRRAPPSLGGPLRR